MKSLFLGVIFLFLLCACSLTNSSSLRSKNVQDNRFAEWIQLYNQNKSLIDDISKCAFEKKQKAIVGLIDYDVESKYAMVGIEGFSDEYVVSDEIQSSSLYLNFERKIKRKEPEKDSTLGKVDLSSVGVSIPSDGIGFVFENDTVVAVKPQIVGDFDLSDEFIRNLNSCANRFNIRPRPNL